MIENYIQQLIRKQRPYYLIQGTPIKGVNNQYWVVFKHRDSDNLLHKVITFLGSGKKQATHKLFRIDPKTGEVFEYTPIKQDNLPSVSLLRTSKLSIIEQFLQQESVTIEKALLLDTFREIKYAQRRFNLPKELDKYHQFLTEILKCSKIYRRSTAYFDSGILKLYEEPLAAVIQTEGEIRLLMDWQGFTKKSDIQELEKLHNPKYRDEFFQRSLREFLQSLEDKELSNTEILAELVRLEFLKIKLIKMESGKAIYHKKTGIFTDKSGNYIQHDGSDNFTYAAHSRNAESITFLYSWDNLDTKAILDSIDQFDNEWQQEELAFDISLEFLQQVLTERERRSQLKRPIIGSITPDKVPPGQTTPVEITGQNLDQVETIEIVDNDLVKVTIDSQEPERIIGQIAINLDHPPTPLTEFKVKTTGGTYHTTTPKKPPVVSQSLEIPEFSEIKGFKQAVEMILAGDCGTPNDFLYWLAQQKPQQFKVERSDLLDELLNNSTLFEHQKSGAQHCLRVMKSFGVAVCADAVGLGKTRLAATVARLYCQQNTQAKIAIIAAKKLHSNWERELAELGFKPHDYELYNKNLMSRKGGDFQVDFNRYGGPDLVIIDEAHEGIRNYRNRIHQTCLQIQQSDRQSNRKRYFLLLTATPWNNRREDIYNILSLFISRPEGFKDLKFPPEVSQWFQNRQIGVENFTDNTELFRRTYKELFLQRTRQMLTIATPDLNLYAKRVAEWLPVQFEISTEQALDQIFSQFETSLYIPFADPIRYLTSNVEQRSLLANQRRFFLQRAESSMYSLSRTIKNFGDRIRKMQGRLKLISPDADGLKEFLLTHYQLESDKKENLEDCQDDYTPEVWDDDYEEEKEEETEAEKQKTRQKLRRSIETNTDKLRDNPDSAQKIYHRMLADCESDLQQLEQIQTLLIDEFLVDHKKQQVTQKVRELVNNGHKVLLISTFSDTVIDYYLYMTRDSAIAGKGIGMLIGSSHKYYPNNSDKPQKFNPGNVVQYKRSQTTLNRQNIFRLFAPDATCKNSTERPKLQEEIAVLIGSETLSVGQNLQDADYLINIDLPWNPMILEQRIGRIDRPKQHKAEYIYVYYANSESQLLRQASRLKNLHKKLVGELSQQQENKTSLEYNYNISPISDTGTLGASIYGDTLFDSEILPGYVDFIQSLIKARTIEQGNLQEDAYKKQETNQDVYTQNEILYSEEMSELLKKLGDDYQANPIAVGRINEPNLPTGLLALTIKYFGPNGELISQKQRTLFWNNKTGEKDGYGLAIATAIKTPVANNIFSAKYLLSCAESIYNEVVQLKQQLSGEIEQPETLENITITSEKISKIQGRFSKMDSLPNCLNKASVNSTLKKLNSWKETKLVQKLSKDYTDGDKAKLDDEQFAIQLVEDTDKLNLVLEEGIKSTSLEISLAALLLRA
ncbi:helicase-related protein [Cylindrospermopsis raciborskii]|uniref:Helicase n=1 Tax=Cylindrospermopsis raciborskii CENA302 TaxID=1170768 RepID=A0A9Q5W7R6_9CYAN|nr:helicase-related protein [Cylindrospermopsis raciborskii]NLQ06173.1 helicase [Cylindrospermopsis raciborskii MVCC19]OHY32475.1 helicase [Cylindrospermopsis raciborskii MVCC14]OPH08608.1 helicase [Cylindrospermopsis raciborskii CENA302]